MQRIFQCKYHPLSLYFLFILLPLWSMNWYDYLFECATHFTYVRTYFINEIFKDFPTIFRVLNYGWLILNRWCASHGHPPDFFFPPLAYCLMFFVSKFQGSKSTSLSVTLIGSISCIRGCDWKNQLFIEIFFPLSKLFLTVKATDTRLVIDYFM